MPARRSSPTTRPPMTPPNSAPPRPASSTGSSTTRRSSCCCAPPLPVCRIWRRFLLFEAATLALCLIVMREILADRAWSAIIPVLAFPAAFWTLGLGQNSFLTAALFGAGTLWVDRRPILAGFCFGALCYKPHFALLVPVALLTGRHWRALGAAFGSAAALCGLSVIVFGWETWHGFAAAAAGSHATYASGRINFGGLVTPVRGRAVGGWNSECSLFDAGGGDARRRSPGGVRVAAQPPAADPGSDARCSNPRGGPGGLVYDLMLGAVAAAWLVRDPAGLAGWERVALTALFVLSIIPPGLAEAWHAPTGPIVAFALLALIAVRALGTLPSTDRVGATLA